ncbi:carboxypeptidase-like regulatory domain-containing protein [Thermococcus gammatolerans]|uniref:carboxypeptidase-like regulatory domain-containing protein n=1 Tax=Thermococcus gammatolerans TaxID=187878 RepID=UPI001EE52241|nr:carboxypeptidase-like regulatory domain-containing protein [Thermococcus gammatolerans]
MEVYDSASDQGYAYVVVTYFDGDVTISNKFGFLKYIDIKPYTSSVTFNFRDALTGQPLTGVTVKDTDGTVLGTVDDEGSLELARGQHTLTFEKTGYWSVTKTIDVQNDTSVSVEMYPSSAAFKLENFPSEITIPEHTVYTLTFTISPINTDATYNTYLSLSGLSDVLEVRKDGSLVSPENGRYYLGDISSPTQISIKFKAGEQGTNGFTMTLESHDAVMTKTYTTTKQVVYKVEPLPFNVQMSSEWQVGTNELRISEASGQSYLVTAVLKDSSGNEVWSDSHAFSPYEAHTFTVQIPKEGSYTLELMWNGHTAVYNVQVNPAISLKTRTLTVEKGSEGTIILHIKNPSSSVQYYTIKVSGGFLPKEISQSISVAPLTEKDVSIAFAVPDKLTYDAYELQVQVLQGDREVFKDSVAVTISGSSSDGFIPLGEGGSGTTMLLLAGGGLAAVLGLMMIRRRR